MERAMVYWIALMASLLAVANKSAGAEPSKAGALCGETVSALKCHAVERRSRRSPDAAAPRFEDIANSPGTTATTTRWRCKQHRIARCQNVRMNRDELNNLVAYILSLKRSPSDDDVCVCVCVCLGHGRRGKKAADLVCVTQGHAGIAVEARCPRPAPQRAHRGRRPDRVRARLQDGPRRHRVEAQGLALPQRPLTRVAEEQEPGLRGGTARGGGRLGPKIKRSPAAGLRFCGREGGGLYAGTAEPLSPLSSSLFEGAASRRLKANEALFVAGEPGDGCYQSSRACSRSS